MKNIIVYGSRFGQFYLEALKRMKGIKIVGLLAKGSDRSYECARYYNIPLYTSLDEVEERVDVACVAVKTGALGGEGANIAKQLLRKGINVLLEQPVHYKELGECYKIAQNQKVYFGVGNLYLNLPAVQNFIRNVHIVSKGVVIEQQAVVNTIIDINERFQVKDKDSILALSQLHFDLSVYDIFGMLATGGTIVIPEKVRYKDPSYWLMLVEKWNITVWNSVPAFMEMFVDYLERFYKGEKLSINKILLSGDWIPVKLPEKICRFLKDVRIYSLGGATEASIWSIYHECKMGESYNSSIPYGVPLSNQGFEVLDANMKPCPDMVQGELYITGKGLAKEYLGDVSKTQSSFFWLNNKRIYKTGDFGRYLRNGEIEFLGRKDSQIKISGHRIDTGEIENAIMDCCSGKNCCVTTVDWNNEPKLVAVIVPKEDEKKDEKSVREALKRYLPQYMIPFFLQFIDEIPCTSNGKVDRQAIRKLFIDKRDDKIQHKRWELENLIDKEIYSILISVLKVDALYPDDNLFELGADSLLMAQIAGRVKEIIEQTKTSVTFDEILRQILNNPTGEAITTFVKSKQNILTSENVRTDDFRIIEKTAKDTVYIFFHTALGTTNCYRFVEKELRKLYLSMWQKYIKELRYLSKNTFMEIVIFRMELHKM